MRLYEWTLIQFKWCLYKKKYRHKQKAVCWQIEKVGHLQAKERSLRRNQSHRHLDLWFPVSRLMRKIHFCCLSHPICLLHYGSPGKLVQRYNHDSQWNLKWTKAIAASSENPKEEKHLGTSGLAKWFCKCVPNWAIYTGQ